MIIWQAIPHLLSFISCTPKKGWLFTKKFPDGSSAFLLHSVQRLCWGDPIFPVQTAINAPLNRSWSFLVFYFHGREPQTTPGFAGPFLKCLLLDFPRHTREVEPGADNPDLYLCGCDALLAPADPLHTQAEEGKAVMGGGSQLCLTLHHLKKLFPGYWGH